MTTTTTTTTTITTTAGAPAASPAPVSAPAPKRASADYSSSDRNDRLFPEEINVLYDSKCNICVWEMQWLCKLDEQRNKKKIRLTDIESPNYDPKDPANGGVEYSTAIRSMHAVTADGQVLEGLSVFRQAYGYAGVGWMVAMTAWPILQVFFDALYNIFAKYRTVITRGTTFEELEQAAAAAAAAKKNGTPPSSSNNNKYNKKNQ